jgi:cytochrome P450
LQIIGRTMLGVDFAGDGAALHHAYTELGASFFRRAVRPWSAPLWVPTRENRRVLRSIRTMVASVRAILRDRARDPREHGDLLDTLLAAPGFTQDEVIHEISAIVLAGHETTATTLTWMLYELSQRPELVERLRRELGDRDPDLADLPRLPLLGRVVDETLRLYPALYVNSRQALRPDVVAGHAVPAGTRLLVNILGIHRSPRYWRDPGAFDPDRFVREEHHRSAFVPFLVGPRRCVGAPLALAELKLILARVMRRFDLRVVPGRVVRPETRAVLQPAGGIRMEVHRLLPNHP